jgi:hypothetical protein
MKQSIFRSAISNQQSINDQQSAINQRSTISNQQSAISNQQSAISNQSIYSFSNQQSAACIHLTVGKVEADFENLSLQLHSIGLVDGDRLRVVDITTAE